MSEHVMEITKDNFKEQIKESDVPAIIDLWAEWCAPCKMIAPTVEEIAADKKESLRVGKINVDNDPELATELSVMNIPTLIFFKEGNEVGRLVGVNTKVKIEQKISELFG